MIGQIISHYKILEKLGEGGMGVVYKAQDMKLDRLVALKFLPHHLSTSEQDKARFIQEAKAASSLNHPNVCTIHAIEEHDGQMFIAMEFVEGQTLRERTKTQIPNLKSAIDIGVQIAEGLAAAHEKGIVHRDIKPENIMVRKDGIVQIMDFGLAKLKGNVSRLTREGSTVGTAGYMSPEQIQGQDADHRSDIFSLGVLLYELLTGQLPFRGVHETALAYEIVNVDAAPMSTVKPEIAPELDRIVLECLAKEPNERYQSGKEISKELRRIKRESGKQHTSRISPTSLPPSRAGKESASTRLPWILAAVFLFLAIVAGVLYFQTLLRESHPTRMSFSLLTDQPGEEISPDISPDGTFIVYTKPESGKTNIYLQRAGGGNAINLTKDASGDSYHASYSLAGDLIAFRSDRDGGGIFIMGSTGESVRRLTTFGYNPSWSPDGKKIVFSDEGVDHPYSRSSSAQLWTADFSDGKVSLLVREGDAVQPMWSPHGHRIAFWRVPRGSGQRDVWTIGADGTNPVQVTNDTYIDWSPQWSPDGGHLYFLSDRGGSMNLWRVRINERSGKVLGDLEPLTLPTTNCATFRLSRDGKRVVYVSQDIRSNIHRVGFDPVKEEFTGSPAPVTRGSKQFAYPNVSPDGRWLAFSSAGVQEDLFVARTDGTGLRKLTNDTYKDRGPNWRPDGKTLAFYSDRSGKWELWSINLDGSELKPLTVNSSETAALPLWFPDGKRIAYLGTDSSFMIDVSQNPVDRHSTPFPAIEGTNRFFEVRSISRNGEYIAGQVKVERDRRRGLLAYSMKTNSYIPILDRGEGPQWLMDSRRLLYLEDGEFHVVDWQTKRTKALGLSLDVSERRFFSYTLAPDNKVLYFIHQERESDIWEARWE
jgi:serine/threonine protein kinase